MKKYIATLIQSSVEGYFSKEGGYPVGFMAPKIVVERPSEERFGEYTSNAALQYWRELAKWFQLHTDRLRLAKQQPGDFDTVYSFAQWLAQQVKTLDVEGRFEKIEVAGPGHLNFFLSQSVVCQVVTDIETAGSTYWHSALLQGKGKYVSNEFISANPTGPLHLGNGRGGFFGDTLSRVLEKAGYQVTNEYYVNDAGGQIEKLGHSVLGDSEAVYGGEYIEQLRTDLESVLSSGDVRGIGEAATVNILGGIIKPTLKEKMNIRFDRFVSEKHEVIEGGYVDRAINLLREKQLTFEDEGALWLRTMDFGDDKNRVLMKSDGTKTYFASDCGYILHKMERVQANGERGFSIMSETWGADHHGYIARFRAAAVALGFSGELRFNIVQMVRLVKDGKEVRMSKRAGNVVTIDELIERVGSDVARFFFLMYSQDTHMNFDLGLAEERSQKNPVYYVQYAHARLGSMLHKAEGELNADAGDISLLVHPKERVLLAELLAFPDLIAEIAESYAVHHLPQYAIRLADRLHSFYDTCRVIDRENRPLSEARLRLVKSVKIVLGETLRLIGVSAPEQM